MDCGKEGEEMTRRKPKTFKETFRDCETIYSQIRKIYIKTNLGSEDLEEILNLARDQNVRARGTWLGKRRLGKEKKDALDRLLIVSEQLCDKVEMKLNSMKLFERISTLTNAEPPRGTMLRDMKKSHMYPHKYPRRLFRRLRVLEQ